MTYLEQFEAATKPILESALLEIQEMAGDIDVLFPLQHIWADNENYLVAYIPGRQLFLVCNHQVISSCDKRYWTEKYGPDQLLPEAICQAADIIKTLV